MDKRVENLLKPDKMKGPNNIIPFIDNLSIKLSMEEWNNIPIPLKTAFLKICEVF